MTVRSTMETLHFILVLLVVLVPLVYTQPTVTPSFLTGNAEKKAMEKFEEEEWEDVTSCFQILTNQTSLPDSPDLSPAEITRGLIKALCGTKDEFIACVDRGLSRADSNSVVPLFKPFFNVSLVSQAYEDICNNFTVLDSDEDLSCLVNSTALVPCYNEYYNYVFYLSVIKRFGSPKRQLSEEVLNTLLCTLAEERQNCELAALRVCSSDIALVMQSFYKKILPSACKEELGKSDE